MNSVAGTVETQRPSTESLRVACRLLREGKQAIGLLAVSKDVVMSPIVTALGAALEWVSHQPSAILAADGNVCASVATLAQRIQIERRHSAHVLVDLSRAQSRGEHGALIDVLDGVLLVCSAGHARDVDLLRVARELPIGCSLGALLVGGRGA